MLSHIAFKLLERHPEMSDGEAAAEVRAYAAGMLDSFDDQEREKRSMRAVKLAREKLKDAPDEEARYADAAKRLRAAGIAIPDRPQRQVKAVVE